MKEREKKLAVGLKSGIQWFLHESEKHISYCLSSNETAEVKSKGLGFYYFLLFLLFAWSGLGRVGMRGVLGFPSELHNQCK